MRVSGLTRVFRNRVDNGLTTYRYFYSGNFSNVTPAPWLGATHSSKCNEAHVPFILLVDKTNSRLPPLLGELPLIFGTHDQYNGNSTEFEWNVSHVMQGKCFFISNTTYSRRTNDHQTNLYP